ncbi:unnamed protein product [Ilex paraguariensis]|uniref:Uncharacterized protein n=1 Tax=Ilex paraguariensis TaxID=185542 RepID=A0ABC8RWI9_9AQUA
MQLVKETSANIAASAKAGLDKTKTVLEEKVEKMIACDPVEKEMAARKKEEKIKEAELRKQVAKSQSTAATTGGGGGGGVGYTAIGAQEMPTMQATE